ncbi:MAG: serine hydrolase [Bradyrhizobium sp.]|nr:serine hydrolase [Bradyrhizobium sp.]MDP3690707.1 serine hydrolase [Bradyrhizobium sp.]
MTTTGYGFGAAHAAMRRLVDGNILPGVSSAVLVGRDLVDVNCVGWADKETQIPLRTDHLFRVFSNTKLITSCAALLLCEEGRFLLDDPIEKFIPQLGNRRVMRPGATSLEDAEPARGSITIRQLLSHSSGLSYGLFDPGTPLFKAYQQRKVLNPTTTLVDMIDTLAELPLAYHPGTSWEYSVATDVVGRLVEVVSGEALDKFIARRIFAPLGMVDTAFAVPEKDRSRLAAYYAGADLMDPMKPGLTRTDNSAVAEAERRWRPGVELAGHGGAHSKSAAGRTDAAEAGNDSRDDDQSAARRRLDAFSDDGRTGRQGLRAGGRADPAALAARSRRCGRRILVGRGGRHAMVDFAENRRRRPADDAAPDGFFPPFAIEFKRLTYEAVTRGA